MELVDVFAALRTMLGDSSPEMERTAAVGTADKEDMPDDSADHHDQSDPHSDIHIEPFEDRLRIRYRIDGALTERPSFPMALHAAIMSRLKIMGGMDIAEKRIKELEEKLAGAERTRDNLIQLGFPTFQSCKEYADEMNYAKAIIKGLLDNSDEYARQRAEDFLKEKVKK